MSKKSKLTGSGQRIADRLNEIREEINAPRASFNPNKWVMSRKEFRKISESIPLGQPIVINGKVHLVYIKDHHFVRKYEYLSQIRNSPNQCFMRGKRLHFYMCSTLKDMKSKGRAERYCAAKILSNNRCNIDLSDQKDEPARLGWCQNCLDILLSDGIISYNGKHHKQSILRRACPSGDSRDIIDCMKSCYHSREDRFKKIKKFFDPFMGR